MSLIRTLRASFLGGAFAALAAVSPLGDACAQGTETDPFADLDRAPQSAAAAAAPSDFFSQNFTFKRELFSQFSHGDAVSGAGQWYSRQSAGFEALKKFSTERETVAAFDFQGRIVRRDNYIPVLDDAEGAERRGWNFEYHNLYADFYNILNPLLSDEARGRQAGRFNFRVGRFYLPFGLNLQTDTHAALLQLSNERNFGFERDWYAGFWGSLSRDFNYDLYYLLGSGYHASFRGQDGMVAGRVSLSSRFLNEYGVEGGVSLMGGQRLSSHALMRSPVVAEQATRGEFIQTERAGIDGRYSQPLLNGTLSGAAELSGGYDESERVLTQLYQLEYLHRSRRWGAASQLRRFWQDFTAADGRSEHADVSLIGELTWYLRNDIGGANLHWVKLNVERRLEHVEGRGGTIVTLQYYRYW